MQINFIYDSSCNSAPAAFKTALQAGANIIDILQAVNNLAFRKAKLLTA